MCLCLVIHYTGHSLHTTTIAAQDILWLRFYFSAIHRFQEVLYHPCSAYQHDNLRKAGSQQRNTTRNKILHFQKVLEVQKVHTSTIFKKGMTISRNYASAV